MEQFKNLVNKITGGRKFRKDQLLIMVLSGILLCIIALPVRDTDSESSSRKKKSDLSDADYDTVGTDSQQESPDDSTQPGGNYDLSYAHYWEEKLEQSLSCIDGAGKVEVLIALRESEERILEKDIPVKISETDEEDAEGGKRTIREINQEESTIYTVNEAGQNVPYVSKIIQPMVEGVVVIAQGGDSALVKENIIETIEVLFGIDANKIRVVKRKSNNS